ncbi:MAG: hypothetical protein SGILL_003895 [Bacillariaceae sp.]
MAPDSHWLMGHLLRTSQGEFRNRQRRLFSSVPNAFGQTGCWYGPQRAVAVTSLSDARKVLSAEYYRARPGIANKHMSMFLGSRNIGCMKGREWKFHHSWALKAMSHTALQHHKVAMKDVCERVVDSILEQKALRGGARWMVNVEDISKMITLDIFGFAGLGIDFECTKRLKVSKEAQAFDILSEELGKRIQSPLWLPNCFYSIPTERNRTHSRARSHLRALLKRTLQERRIKNRTEPPEQDLLGAMLVALDANKELIYGEDDNEEQFEQMISDMMITLMFAGYDTTSITLTYALYLVSQHPEVEQRCREEIRVSNPEDCAYCKGVIFEALRMFPPGTLIYRTIQKSIVLDGGFIVPRDAHVLIPIWLIQNTEENFPRPEEFHPERWVRRNEASKADEPLWVDRNEDDRTLSSSSIPPANRRAFFAFSAGGRSCPGYKFAIQEAGIALSTLLRELKFTVVPEYDLRPSRKGIVQGPLGGMPMFVERINSNRAKT